MKEDRLLSLDALRGFDMMFITGFAGLLMSFCAACGAPDCWLVTQMKHVEWEGLRIMDLIFPTFLFIAGVSFPYSYAKRRARGVETGLLVWQTIRRGLTLFLLGMICQKLLSFDFAHQRVMSVLGRIGLSWMFAAFLFMAFRWRVRMGIAFAFLLGYGLLMYFGHAPDYPTADRFSAEGSILCWVDRQILGAAHMYKPLHEPEGIVGTITGIVTAMLGMFAGELLRTSLSGLRKTLTLVVGGLLCLLLGFGIDACGVCPINKALWSPTFVLAAGGYSTLALALFYYVIDVRGYRRWTFYLRVIGMNAITIYVTQFILRLAPIRDFFFGGCVKLVPAPWTSVANAAAYMLLVWLYLFFLYRKNIFLRV